MKLIMWVACREPNTSTIFDCVAYVTLCHYNMYYWYLQTWKERSDVKTYVYCMAKLSIKYLFASCGYISSTEWHIHILWLRLNGPLMGLM